jgi:hypothetical protein
MGPSNSGRRRRLLVPVIAALLALGASAPIASAEVVIVKNVNDGTLSGDHTRADAEQCRNYKAWYDADKKAGDTKGATYTKNLADARGCRWAERLVTTGDLSQTIAPEPSGISPGETTAPIKYDPPQIVVLGPIG